MKSIWLTMAVGIFGGLGVFLYGMRVMSQGLESVGGDTMRKWLQRFTSHPIAGIFTGLLVTCVIQSSSATTVMLVSLVHAGFLNLAQGISVILGANIGTTLTGWLVAILGFKIKIAKFALPAVGAGVLFIFLSTKNRNRAIWGEILVGFGLLFLGLMFMKDSVSVLKQSESIKQMLHAYSASSGLFSMMIIIGIGTIVTVVIQSSSATIALTITLAHQGLIDFPTAAALILGENIGTTITANLAAIGTEVTAQRAARAHFIFNISGVLWAMILFMPFLSLVDMLVPGDPFAKELAVRKGAIAPHMAAFHTTFNIINTLLFLPFIGILAKIATKMVSSGTPSAEPTLKYINQGGTPATPDVALVLVKKELVRMHSLIIEMFDKTIEGLNDPKKDLSTSASDVRECKSLVVTLEDALKEYLMKLSESRLSRTTSVEVTSAIHIAHHIKNTSKHIKRLHSLLEGLRKDKRQLSTQAQEELPNMVKQVKELLELVHTSIEEYKPIADQAEELEQGVKKLRNELRIKHTKRLQDGSCELVSGLTYIDMLAHFRQIGNDSFNIAKFITEAYEESQ